MQTNLAYELLRVRSMLVVVLAPLDVMKERKDTRVIVIETEQRKPPGYHTLPLARPS